MIVPALLVAGALLGSTCAQAGLAASALEELSLQPPAGARLPLQEQWRDEDGAALTLGAAIDHHAALVVFADFTCSTLCGPVVTFAADALVRSGLRPGADFKLIVLGIDPKDGPVEATRMKQVRIVDPQLRAASIFLTGDNAVIRRTAEAVGYRFAYDSEHDAFAHPAAALVASGDGRIARVLSGLGLTPDDLRLALVEAGQGRLGSLGDRLRLLCYGFDPTSGVYTLAVHRVVAIASGCVTLALVAMIAWLSLIPRMSSRSRL